MMTPPPERTEPSLLLKIIVAALTLFTSLLLLELLVYLTDPLGIIRYFRDTERFVFRLDDEVGYRLEPGSYAFTTSSSVILEDGTRRVPATNANAACTILALGDSITFGQGVSDDETWVNRLAERFPEVRFVNAGVPGYNLPNLVPQYQRYKDQADAILYTLIDNDVELSISREPPITAPLVQRSAVFLYLHALKLPRPPLMPEDQYRAYLDTLYADPRVFVTAFASGGISNRLAQDYPRIILQPMWTQVLSRFDQHPSPQGHEQIAQTTAPIIEDVIAQVCPDRPAIGHHPKRINAP